MNVLPCPGMLDKSNFAAEQHGQFAADRQSETRTAIFARGAGVGLLKCFEDESLLFGRTPMPVSSTEKAMTCSA